MSSFIIHTIHGRQIEKVTRFFCGSRDAAIVFEFVHVFSLESGNFMALQLRDKSTCKYDQISLGEVMLRLDPGEGRIRTARHFTAWEGGGEYNTSRGLRKCFGYKTAVCPAFVDNEVGHLIEDFIMQGGVDTDFIKWREDDGIGR